VDGEVVEGIGSAVPRRRRRVRQRRAAVPSTEWPVFAPAVPLAPGPLGEVQAADREIARWTAVRAQALAAYAATRPASTDRTQGEPGAMSAQRWAARADVLRPVSEWAAQELVVALSVSHQRAETELARALMLVQRLPGTVAALRAGALHAGHLFPLLEVVAPIADARVRAEVEAEVLRWAAGRQVTTPAELGAKARREASHRDARAAARELTEALRARGVFFRTERTAGVASVVLTGSLPEARAVYQALGAHADALSDDPAEDGSVPRTRGQKMVDCLLDLVLRPGECELPPVQVLLTVAASLGTLLGGDEPGEIDGQPVPAELVRDFLDALTGRARALQTAEPGTAADATVVDGVAAAERAARAAEEAWQAFLAAEGAAVSEELERRIWAGDFDEEPDPATDEEWLRHLLDDLHPDHLQSDHLQSDDRGPEPETGDEHLSDGDGGWWASADRAVDEASLVLSEAEAALGHARRLVRTAARADAADETAWRHSPAGRVEAAGDALTALQAAADTQREWLADLLAATAGGGLADRPRIALTDALSGTLLALTDLPTLRRTGRCDSRGCRRSSAGFPHSPGCDHDLSGRPGLGPPPPTTGYRPGADLDRYVRARDRRCRFPGCRRRVPEGGELDHHQPYPDGPTAAANLAGYCTCDHRLKHQAPGWTFDLAADATLTVTTPTGLVANTTPPPY